MKPFSTIRSLSRRRSVRGLVLLLVLAGLLAYGLRDQSEADTPVTASTRPVVSLTTAEEYQGDGSISLIGNVRAFSEAEITSESAGRVTSVPVSLGDSIQAGQVVATLENAAQQAAVLQAEGSYEAALAAAAQSGVGVDEAQTNLERAENNALNSFRSAYTTVNGVVQNNIDQFFSNPDSSSVPGLRINGRGFTSELNSERVSFQTILPTWQSKTNSLSRESDIDRELQYALEITERTINFVDTFIAVFNDQSNSRYSEAELQTFSTNFSSLRSSLLTTQNSLESAQSNLANARDALRRAEFSGGDADTSASSAQVKQALGSLRAAQANLEKTILRSPISGTVNAIDVRLGDFINAFTPVAVVANNDALEIVTYVGTDERSLIAIGDTVTVENEFTGTITAIAPAVDTGTRKTEVRIATESTTLQNGDTVNIEKVIQGEDTSEVIIPLAAVKLDQEDGRVFRVEDGVLVAQDVTLGVVRGGSVTIREGLSPSESFVADVRSLVAGTEVDIAE